MKLAVVLPRPYQDTETFWRHFFYDLRLANPSLIDGNLQLLSKDVKICLLKVSILNLRMNLKKEVRTLSRKLIELQLEEQGANRLIQMREMLRLISSRASIRNE